MLKTWQADWHEWRTEGHRTVDWTPNDLYLVKTVVVRVLLPYIKQSTGLFLVSLDIFNVQVTSNKYIVKLMKMH